MTDTPPAPDEGLALRAVAACRGSKQKEWAADMATLEGFRAGFNGQWAASRYRSFDATRSALARVGIRTVQVATGPRGGKRWFLDPVPLTDIEIELWRVGMQDAVVTHDGQLIPIADFPGLTLLTLEAVAQAMHERPWQWVDLDSLLHGAVDALSPTQSCG